MRLRRWHATDTEQYVALLAKPEVTRYMLPTPRTRVEALSGDFLDQWRDTGWGPFAAVDKSTGAWIGQIGLSRLSDWPRDDNVEVGFELHPAYWGRGLAVEGTRASIGFGFRIIGLGRIISTTNPANTRSRRVMEKLGLAYQGTRRYHGRDTVWYAISREAAVSA